MEVCRPGIVCTCKATFNRTNAATVAEGPMFVDARNVIRPHGCSVRLPLSRASAQCWPSRIVAKAGHGFEDAIVPTSHPLRCVLHGTVHAQPSAGPSRHGPPATVAAHRDRVVVQVRPTYVES